MYGYDGLVAEKVEILLSEEVGDYQGDLYFVVTDGSRFGWLVTGYGSCSGCDAYEAASEGWDGYTLKELQDELINSISWYNSLEELKDYVRSTPEETHWYSYENGWNEVKEKVLAL